MRRSAFLFTCAALVCSTPAFGQSKDRAIPEWLVAGTFPVDTGPNRVTRAYLGDETGAVAVADGIWKLAVSDSMGRVNLLRVFTTQRENAAAYGFIYIISPADRTINLGFETDDDGMAWLNGALVHHKEVARGVRETDTLTLRLARGVNRLMYKVVNRSGGFGIGGRLLANSPDPINDLTITARKPEQPLATGPKPFVTIGEPHLSARAVLDSAGGLTIPLFVNVTRWGNTDQPVTVAFAGTRVAAPRSEGSLPVPVELRVSWNDIVTAARKGDTRVAALWSGQNARSTHAVRPTDVLGVFSKPILIDFKWQGRRIGDWQITIPPALAGLTLALDVAEFIPGSTITLNGAPANVSEPQQMVTLCDPCSAGAPVRIHIDTNGSEWWDSPRLFVQNTGYSDLVNSARYARIITGDSSIAVPSDSVATQLLLLLANKDKTAYHAAISALAQKQTAVAATLRRDTIDLIGNSHIDAAWLWRWPETVEVVRNTWRTAVKLLDKYPEMKFAASAAQYYVWLEHYEPDLLAKIQQLVKEGRWIIVGGMWVESDVNMPTGESLAMQELYGQRTFYRLFGRYAQVAWIPDTFGYPWQLPQVFSQAGMNGFITQKLRWNDTNEWTADRNYFVWQGRDGTRLPTYIPFGYDHDLEADRLAREFRAQADSAATRRLLTLYGVGDHGGGPTMQMLDRAQETKRAPAFPVLRDVDPEVSMQAMARDIAKAPTINDELYFEYHRGVQTTQSENKKWNRRMEGLLLAADAAAAAVPAPYPHAALSEAWHKILFNQFHDILPGSGIGPIYEDSKVDYRAADSLGQNVLHAALVALSRPLDTRAARKNSQTYFVFNPSGYARSGMAILPDSSTIFVRDVPPVGGTIVDVAQAPVKRSVAGTVLETDSLRLEIDPATGNIAKLFDKRLQRDVLAAGAQANSLMMQPDNPKDWDAWNIDAVNGPWTPVKDSVKIGTIEDSGDAVSLVVERAGPAIHARQKYVLPKHAARVDIENTIDWHAEHKLLKAFFPLAPRADSVWAEIAFGAIGRPAVPTSRKDSARFELPMHRWIDASESGWGVSLINDSKYGYSVHHDTLALSLLRAPKWPDPNADMGTHTFRYSIVPHRGTWRSGATMQAADELNRPLRAVPVDQHAGAGRATSLLRVDGDGVELSAVKRAEENEDLIVRVVERNGGTSDATIVLPTPAQWRETDLVERSVGEWQNSDGHIVLKMRPWQIRTVEIKR